jgi:hypothetical protein
MSSGEMYLQNGRLASLPIIPLDAVMRSANIRSLATKEFPSAAKDDPFIEGQHLPIVSLVCEMAYTINEIELVRLTVLDDNDRLVF